MISHRELKDKKCQEKHEHLFSYYALVHMQLERLDLITVKQLSKS